MGDIQTDSINGKGQSKLLIYIFRLKLLLSSVFCPCYKYQYPVCNVPLMRVYRKKIKIILERRCDNDSFLD